jgi:hypothetical protein
MLSVSESVYCRLVIVDLVDCSLVPVDLVISRGVSV